MQQKPICFVKLLENHWLKGHMLKWPQRVPNTNQQLLTMNYLPIQPLFICLLLSITTSIVTAQHINNLSMEEYYKEGLRLHDEGNYVEAEGYYDISIAMNPLCEKCLYNRGLVRSELNKNNKALADFNSLLTINPLDIEAYEQRAHLRFLTGDLTGAITDFSTVINSTPTAVAFTNRGAAYLDMKRYPDAIRDLENAIRLDTAEGLAYRIMGDAFFATNQPEQALPHYDKAILINDRDIMAYNNRGNTYQILGRDEEALADYNAAIALLENSFTYTNRAKYWIKKENYVQAGIDAKAATKLDFNNPEAYYCVGLVENALSNYKLAAANFNKAIALDHNRAVYYNGRGLALFHLKEYKDAQSDFEQALLLNPADAAVKDRIADCYQKQVGNTAVVAAVQTEEGNEEEEEEDQLTERGVSLVSYSVIGVPTEGTITHESKGQEEKDNNINTNSESAVPQRPAVEVFYEKGVSLQQTINTTTISSDQAIQEIALANDYFQRKWYNQAIQHYTAAIQSDAQLAEAFYKRAQCYMFIKENDLAIADLNEYLLLVPTDANAFNDRGTLHFRQGNIFGALEDYNYGLKIDPHHNMLLSNRGRWQLHMGYFSEAIADFNLVIRSGEASPDIYYQSALASFEQQDYATVFSNIDHAIGKSDIQRYEYFFLKAKVQMQTAQYEMAITNFDKTIELSPRFAEGYIYRAVIYRQLKNKTAACEDFQMAAALGYKAINEQEVDQYCMDKEAVILGAR
jgi:tetratricopeptide (TPR) repeat protein